MLPIAQLYNRDIPGLRPPGRADPPQIQWCPFNHGLKPCRRLSLRWRTAATVASIRTEPQSRPGSSMTATCRSRACSTRNWSPNSRLHGTERCPVERHGDGAGSSSEGPPRTAPSSCLQRIPTEVGWFSPPAGRSAAGRAGASPAHALTPAHLRHRDDPIPDHRISRMDPSSRSWIPHKDQAHADDPLYVGAVHPAHPTMIRSATTTACSSTPARHHWTTLTPNESSELLQQLPWDLLGCGRDHTGRRLQ